MGKLLNIAMETLQKESHHTIKAYHTLQTLTLHRNAITSRSYHVATLQPAQWEPRATLVLLISEPETVLCFNSDL